jgi:hypothetical protein
MTVLTGKTLHAAAAAFALVLLAVPVSAQVVEIAPLGGYRFGGDVFEFVANRSLDLDGAPIVGGAVNVEMSHGLWFEALYTRQQVRVEVPAGTFTPAESWNVVVDQWLAGGRQDFYGYRARPFLSGLVGLTRIGSEGDNEIRFTAGAGGGVRLPIQRRVALRLDSRVLATFLDAAAVAATCGGGGTCIAARFTVAWQMEFTANVAVAFGSPRQASGAARPR